MSQERFALKKEHVIMGTPLKQNDIWPAYWGGEGGGMFGKTLKTLEAKNDGSVIYGERCRAGEYRGFTFEIRVTNKGEVIINKLPSTKNVPELDKKYVAAAVNDVKRAMRTKNFQDAVKFLHGRAEEAKTRINAEPAV